METRQGRRGARVCGVWKEAKTTRKMGMDGTTARNGGGGKERQYALAKGDGAMKGGGVSKSSPRAGAIRRLVERNR